MKKIIFLKYWLLVCLVYILLAVFVNKSFFGQSSTPYYNYLIDSFVSLKINLDPPNTYDLSQYKNSWYMYWGPAPVLLILPFYLFFGLGASDVFYTLISGLLAVGFFGLLLKQAINHFKLKVKMTSFLVIFLSFSMASPLLFLSLAGRIWFTSQVVATLYLLVSLCALFVKLNNPSSSSFFWIVSVIFFNLSWLSRYTLVFYFLILLYGLSQLKKYRQVFKKSLIQLIFISLFFVFIFLIYNYLRFDNIFDVGFRYQVGSKRYLGLAKKWGFSSLHYLRHNIYFYFVNPLKFFKGSVLRVLDLEGNSILIVYPALWLLLGLFKEKNYSSKSIAFIKLSILIVLLTLARLLLNYGTGYVQFGNRYFLDVIPLLYLLLIFAINQISRKIKLFVLILGIFINISGSLIFYHILTLLGQMPR